MTLIAIEGLDGAGKTTQVALLADALSAVEVVSFPRYDTFFGRHIRDLLDATSGLSAQTVDPRSMALWYALDRAQWARDRKPAPDGVVLLNRYTLSNAVYQSARAGDPALFEWVLDVGPETSQRRVAFRGDHDVYERATDLLARVRDGYLAAAASQRDVVVVDASGAPSDVHAAVLRALAPFLS
jgi:dTMP kinase